MKSVIAILALIATISYAQRTEYNVQLWAPVDPGIRIESVKIEAQEDIESCSRSIKQADGTYSVQLIDHMINLTPISTNGAPLYVGELADQFRRLECTQDELIAASLACDPPITWLGSYGDDKSTVIKRAMITKAGMLLGGTGETLTNWVNQVIQALDE